MAVLLKTAVPPESLAGAARKAVYSVDGNLPLGNVRPLQALVSQSISQPRFYMTLLAAFAGEALVMASVGVALGVSAAFLLTEWLVAKLLFDPSPHDPVTFVPVAGLSTIVSLAAVYGPARRATRVDPIVALRAE